MSLLGSIGGALKGAVGGFITGGPMGAGMGAVMGAKGPNKSKNANKQRVSMGYPAMAPTSRSLVGLPSSNTYSASGPVAATPSQIAGSVLMSAGMWPSTRQLGLAPNGGVVRLKKNGQPYKKYRSMNPMNPRAARRAIRRIKGARKMLQQIERQLPKQRVHSRPRASAR